jgi:hypothetical protein
MKTYRVKDMLTRRWQDNTQLSEDVVLFTDNGTMAGYFSYCDQTFVNRSFNYKKVPITDLLDCFWEYYKGQSESDIDRICGIPVEPCTD